MAGWAGFTDDDLQKIKQSDGPVRGGRGGQQRGAGTRPPLSAPSSSGPQRGRSTGMRKSTLGQVRQIPTAEPVSPDALFSQPKQPEPRTRSRDSSSTTQSNGNQTGTGTPDVKSSTAVSTEPSDGCQSHGQKGAEEPGQSAVETALVEPDDTADMVTDDNEILRREIHNVENFQKQQKQIEELNKRKKQMLSSAIQERSKRAKAETTKLSAIQKELARLDQLLVVDVSIIRDKIEEASRHFLDAQKRYDRAEKEFIESKLDLHAKSDVKESLTEHLYTVIYQNEIRKAKKLAELMRKLELVDAGEQDGEGEEMVEVAMPHPSFLSPVTLPAGRYGGPQSPPHLATHGSPPPVPKSVSEVNGGGQGNSAAPEAAQDPGNAKDPDATKSPENAKDPNNAQSPIADPDTKGSEIPNKEGGNPGATRDEKNQTGETPVAADAANNNATDNKSHTEQDAATMETNKGIGDAQPKGEPKSTETQSEQTTAVS